MIDEKLSKNAEFDDAVDVFKYRGKKYPIDTEEYNRDVPATAGDYEHVCRFPLSVLEDYFQRPHMSEVSYVLSGRKDWIKRLKDNYCTSGATRLREPDMVCLAKSFGNKPECNFLMERSLESIAEVGGGKHSWSHPYYGTQEDMLMQPWRDAIYRDKK
jgi:hypothetical protein